MTPRQMELARHALGLPNQNRQSYRNRYFVNRANPAHEAWMRMVSDGLAERFTWEGDNGDLFVLTRKGAEAALKPRERLCPEDFPALAQEPTNGQ